MNVILSRKEWRQDGIFGELADEKGNVFAVTLEHSFQNPNTQVGGFHTAIAQGTYECVRFQSPHLGYEVFMLKDVPSHDYILIHIGNYNHESEGCILIGTGIGNKLDGGKMICDSKKAFNAFMKMQEGIDSFHIIVQDCK